MAKCILLVRVSSEGQDLEQQTEKVREEAVKDGFKDIVILEDKESAVTLSKSGKIININIKMRDTLYHY